nr:hypothetical protein Iba_chr02bCG19050 [Ipomoea batatas]
MYLYIYPWDIFQSSHSEVIRTTEFDLVVVEIQEGVRLVIFQHRPIDVCATSSTISIINCRSPPIPNRRPQPPPSSTTAVHHHLLLLSSVGSMAVHGTNDTNLVNTPTKLLTLHLGRTSSSRRDSRGTSCNAWGTLRHFSEPSRDRRSIIDSPPSLSPTPSISICEGSRPRSVKTEGLHRHWNLESAVGRLRETSFAADVVRLAPPPSLKASTVIPDSL